MGRYAAAIWKYVGKYVGFFLFFANLLFKLNKMF